VADPQLQRQIEVILYLLASRTGRCQVSPSQRTIIRKTSSRSQSAMYTKYSAYCISFHLPFSSGGSWPWCIKFDACVDHESGTTYCINAVQRSLSVLRCWRTSPEQHSKLVPVFSVLLALSLYSIPSFVHCIANMASNLFSLYILIVTGLAVVQAGTSAS
jgi:hypothetical protein